MSGTSDNPHGGESGDVPILSYRSAEPRPPADVLRTVADMPAPEAAMARAKLDAEGIRSFIVGEDVSGMHPLLFSSVQLQVMEEDLEHAREVLDRPAEDHHEGEYADEAWRCPKCHRRQIDILPLSAGYRRLRLAGIVLFVVPLLLLIALNVMPETDAIKSLREIVGAFGPVWLLAVIIIAAVVLFSARGKRCKSCGHEWTKDAD